MLVFIVVETNISKEVDSIYSITLDTFLKHNKCEWRSMKFCTVKVYVE